MFIEQDLIEIDYVDFDCKMVKLLMIFFSKKLVEKPIKKL